MSWVGRRVLRRQDPALLRGEGRFTADAAAGALAMHVIRSPIPKGRIRAIRKPAGAMVITAADLGAIEPICPKLYSFNYVPIIQPILPKEQICHVGQALAVVVAATLVEAEDIAEQVAIEMDQEQAIAHLDQALCPGAPLVHADAPGNVVVEGRIETGSVDLAFEQAARVVHIEIRSRRQSAMPLETRGGVARFDRATGRVALVASTQMPHMLRTGIADCLGMPECDLQVIAPDVGGAFGQKMALIPEYVLLVWLARRLRQAVAWIEDRRENLIAGFHARDQRYKIKAAFDRDGRFLAVEADIQANIGAFSCYPVTCGVEPLMALVELPGPYRLPAYRARARGVTTNTCPIAPYRGVSRPAITFAMERLIDSAARALDIDPIDLRRRNLVDQFPFRTVTGLLLDEASYVETLNVAVDRIDLVSFREEQQAARAAGRYLGVGFSVFNERTGYGTPAFAARSMAITPGYEQVQISMTPSGEVELRIGASPHGQGLETSLAQIVADELGLDVAEIRVIHGDTDRTPYGWGTFASRSLVIAGGAAKLAAIELAGRIRLVAAKLLQTDPTAITLDEGKAAAEGQAGSLTLRNLARTVYHKSPQTSDVVGFDLSATASYDPPGTFSNACHAAVVEVDPETGAVRILRFVVAEDAGRLINPMIVDGQIQGGVAQGIANALFEEIIYDQDGHILTGSLADYIPPTAAEIPTIEISHLVTPSDASLTGAKGLGEGGAIGAPAAVINAICDALGPHGVELFEMPATPQRVREAIRRRQQAMERVS